MVKYDERFKRKIVDAYLNRFLDMFNGEILSYRLPEIPNTKANMRCVG